MSKQSLATRYARALYNYAKETNQQDVVFEQLRAVGSAIDSDTEITAFVNSPLVLPTQKAKAIDQAISTLKLAEPLKNFTLLLAKKNRLGIFAAVVEAFQTITDEAHGVTRGVVRSATVLGAEDRLKISELVSRATKKQVILTYKEDPALVGGLVAEVGSFTFDDSLVSHLKRINEQLNRSVQ
jgi:F-type H+-transporting ATPase subunit delta